jgi:multiple sugar transport system ATP-binding protein
MSLTLEKVNKIYGHGRFGVHAVQDLSLDVAPGEIVALLGSSGCGKTSTLRMIAGLERVSAGEIRLNGRRIDPLPPARRGVAMAFEGYALYPPLSVAENIGFGLTGLRSEERARRVQEVAELLDITDILDRRPSRLSGGQQQRTSLARALIREAELYLLDEPMGQLEPQLRAVLRGRIKAWLKARGAPAILVTHDQTEANAMADRIAIMEGGVLQQFAPPATLRERPANLFVATFFGEPPMNILEGEIEAGALHLAKSAQPLPLPRLRRTPRPGPVKVGVRPHDITLGEGPLTGRVLSNQWLGDESHVALDAKGRLVVAVILGPSPAASGASLAFGFAPERLHLFDPETGVALTGEEAP